MQQKYCMVKKQRKKLQILLDQLLKGRYRTYLPEIKLKISEINEGINILDFLAKNKIMSSKSEARRAIVNRGLRIDNIIIEDENKTLKRVI